MIEDQELRIEEILSMRVEDGSKIMHFCHDFGAGIEDRQFKIEDED